MKISERCLLNSIRKWPPLAVSWKDPSEKGEWKPHPKSFSSRASRSSSRLSGWLQTRSTETELNLSGASPYSYEKTEDLLAMFDKNVREARAAIAASKDDDYNVQWSLKAGGRAVFTESRRNVVRNHINHLCHHRGQLTVYLRLIDVPLPAIYGPSADERMPGF